MRNMYFRVLCAVWSLLVVGGAPATNAADSLVTDFWTGIDDHEGNAQRSGTKKGAVSKGTSRLLRIDLHRLKAQVAAASSTSSFSIVLPAPDGTQERFDLRSSSVMPPGLAARYPSIRAYEGVAVDDPSVTIRMEITDKGLSAQILGANKRWLIDPADDRDPEVSRSYKHGASLGSKSKPFCELDTRNSASGWQSLSPEPNQVLRAKSTSGAIKTFRTAVATTGEYGVYHGGTVEGVLSAVVATMNRVDGIFESELGISLELVDNNDLIVFTDTITDPFSGNDNASVLIDESQAEIDARIGAENYDVGHTLSTGAGGLASLGAVCRTGFKAQGVTGASRPEGDFFDVDYVAHELGHQFAADHTWNGSGGGCGPQQRGADSAYEPGSGSSIMSYAGLCGADNIASAVDALFHHQSFEEIITYTTEGVGAACGVESDIGNTVPEVIGGADYVVPKQTPLVVSGSATDMQQEVLQYSWEQRDLGPQAALTDPDDGRIPLFRMLPASSDGTRYLPALSTVVSGSTSLSERTPQIGRDMNMRLTVKDGVGGVQSDDIVVSVDGNSGPFTVVSPNGGERVGGSRTIRWDSAFTEQTPVSATTIDVYLSTDAGVSFDQLIGSVDNTGIATVSFPSGIQSTTARLMLRGADNIFYDVSDGVFELDSDRAVPATPTAERIDAGDGQLTLVFAPGLGGTVVADNFEAYCATASTVTETPFSLDAIALPFDENMPITSELEVNEDFTIETDGLRVPMNITHTWRGDVIIDLRSPAGTTVRLKDNSLPNDGEDNVVETYPTTAAPSEPLSAFEGESTLGTWTLSVSDFQTEDSGQLESWGITVVLRSPQSEGTGSATQSPITIGGLVNGEEYACTVTPIAAGWPGESVSFERATPSGSTDSSLTPSFAAPVATSDGFTVQVSNYDDNYSWAVTSTAGSASINTSGLVTLTGLTPGQSATATVTTTRAGVDDGSADVTGSASVGDALTPRFDALSSTVDGFTVQVSNYDGDFTWGVAASAGSVSINESGLVAVSGLNPGQASTVTVTTTRSGYGNGAAEASGSATIGTALTPTFAQPTSTADGFTAQVTNYNASFTWSASSSAGAAEISETGLVTVIGLAPEQSATVTVSTTQAGFESGAGDVSGSAATGAALVPVFGEPISTVDGFTVQVNNYDASFTWNASSSAGAAEISETGLVTVTGLASEQSATITVSTTQAGFASGAGDVSGSAATGAALVPVFGEPISTVDGFTVQVTNYDASFTWNASSSAGAAEISETGLVTVTGLAPEQSATVTVSTTQTGFASGSGDVSGSAATGAALVPVFGEPISTVDGFTVQVSNYDDNYSWAVTSTAGSASINTSGLVTLTGLTPGQSATATVTTTRAGVDDGSADVTGSASVGDALTPRFDALSSTVDGFTVQVSNYDGDFTWGVAASAGSVSINESGLVAVSGLNPGQASTVTVTTTRSGYGNGAAEASGSATIGAALTPAFAQSTSTADGFTAQVINYNASFTWNASSSAGAAEISETGLVTVTGLAPEQSATVTVSTTQTGFASGSGDVSGSAATGAALVPVFGEPISTVDGFTVQVTNYDPDYTWAVAATAGAASISGSGLVVVEGLTLGQNATLTVSTSRSGFASASEQLTGSALTEAPPLPTIAVANLELSTTDFKGGDGDRVVLGFTAQSDAADAQIDGLVLASSGALNESSEVGQVKVFVDVNGDGAPGASEQVAESAFSADNGTITFEFSEPVVLTTDGTRILISYEL